MEKNGVFIFEWVAKNNFLGNSFTRCIETHKRAYRPHKYHYDCSEIKHLRTINFNYYNQVQKNVNEGCKNSFF